MKPTRRCAPLPALPDSRRHEPHGGEESPHPARVAGEQGQMRHVSVCADEEVRQGPRLLAARAPVSSTRPVHPLECGALSLPEVNTVVMNPCHDS